MYSFSLNVATKYIGKNIILLKSVSSTNSYLFNYDGILEEGTTVIASEQTAGRGRFNRKWFSMAGKSLIFSILLKPNVNPVNLPQLTQVASLAIAKAIDRLCSLDVMIKWPNDIYINDKKFCGILTETKFNSDDLPIVVLGVGINVNEKDNDIPDEIKGIASSLYIETGIIWSLEKLLLALLVSLEYYYELWLNNSFSTLLNEIEVKLYLKGKEVMVSGESILQGKVLGVDGDGYLLIVSNRDRKTYRVASGEIILCS